MPSSNRWSEEKEKSPCSTIDFPHPLRVFELVSQDEKVIASKKRALLRSQFGKSCEPMEMRQITPLYFGVSGYPAEVCHQLEIARMVSRMVSWDETQRKVSSGALELKVRRQQFVVTGNPLIDCSTMTSIFDIMQTVLAVLLYTPEGVQGILPSNTDTRVYQMLELTGLDQTAYTSKR